MQTMDAAEFTAMAAIKQMQVLNCAIEEEASADKETVAKPPHKFKELKTLWIFDEGIWTYLGLLKRTGRVPLIYVIQRLAIPEAAAVYQMPEEQQGTITPLFGPDCDRDNTRVYNVLKQLCLIDPGRTYILLFDARSDRRAV